MSDTTLDGCNDKIGRSKSLPSLLHLQTLGDKTARPLLSQLHVILHRQQLLCNAGTHHRLVKGYVQFLWKKRGSSSRFSRRLAMPCLRLTEGTLAAASRRRCTNLPLWKDRPATSPSKPSVGYPTFACSPSLNMQYP